MRLTLVSLALASWLGTAGLTAPFWTLVGVLAAGEKAGATWDPDGLAAEAGAGADPDGLHSSADAGGGWDPNG